MKYLKSQFGQAFRFVLILSCLLNSMIGLVGAERWSHSSTAGDRVRTDEMSAMTAVAPQRRARVRQARGRLPLSFEANAGQFDSQVRFYSRGDGYNLFLTPNEAVLALRNEKSKDGANPQSVVRMKLAGANGSPRMEGIESLSGKSNYFIGNDSSKWRRNVASYAKVRYLGVYPGIDMVYYGVQREIEYDFIVAPGADPKTILLEFEGTRRIEIDSRGDLVLHTAGGQARQRKPVTYQEAGGRRKEIASRYRLEDGNRVGFEIAAYDRSRPLVIDPALVYSTYLGGGDLDSAESLAVDAEGNIYIAGYTRSPDFPTAEPLQPICKNCPASIDIFVAKLNPEGSALIYSTFLGGSDMDDHPDIAVDSRGNVYLAGYTLSDDFPTKDPLQPARAGSLDAFVTKLNADGSAIVYSTYLGGSRPDAGNVVSTKLAVDREGNAYVTGATLSADFPTKNPLQPALKGFADVFVTKLNASGSALVYSTYLGGELGLGLEQPHDIAVDRAGNAYVTGWTASFDFPTVNPLQPALNGNSQDAFITKLSADGSAIVYSTYLGGSFADFGLAIAVDALGSAYLTGETQSDNFPTVSPGLPLPARRRSMDSTYPTDFQMISPIRFGLSSEIDALTGAINPDGSAIYPTQVDPLPPPDPSAIDSFVSKIEPDGSALVYSTYLGGSDIDTGRSIAVDAKGHAYVGGTTISLDFPTVDVAQPAPDPTSSQLNAYIVKLNPEGADFIYSSYLGGGGSDYASGIAVDARGDVYVVGQTTSEDLSVTSEAFQRSPRGSDVSAITEGFITKISNRFHDHNHKHDHDDDDKDRR